MTVYNKLVRDRIPEIIEAEGKEYKVRILRDRKYLKSLNKKLEEELKEYNESGEVEELADLVEIIYAILRHKEVSIDEFEKIRMEKREKRGGFEKRLFLLNVDDSQFADGLQLKFENLAIGNRKDSVAVDNVELIGKYEDVLRNVKQFNSDLQDKTGRVVKFLAMFKQWYYIEELDMFGPSNYIGYKDMDIDMYIRNHYKFMDGRDTELALNKMFVKCNEGSVQYDSLNRKLEDLLDTYGKKIRSNARIAVKR